MSVSRQEARVEIKPATEESSAVEVKVNAEEEDKVGADVLFGDMKARSQ